MKRDREIFTGLDFWNDPQRWAGIDDPRKQKFWMVDRPPVQVATGFVGQGTLAKIDEVIVEVEPPYTFTTHIFDDGSMELIVS